MAETMDRPSRAISAGGITGPVLATEMTARPSCWPVVSWTVPPVVLWRTALSTRKRWTQPVDGDVIHGDAALRHQLLNVPVGQHVAMDDLRHIVATESTRAGARRSTSVLSAASLHPGTGYGVEALPLAAAVLDYAPVLADIGLHHFAGREWLLSTIEDAVSTASAVQLPGDRRVYWSEPGRAWVRPRWQDGCRVLGNVPVISPVCPAAGVLHRQRRPLGSQLDHAVPQNRAR